MYLMHRMQSCVRFFKYAIINTKLRWYVTIIIDDIKYIQ